MWCRAFQTQHPVGWAPAIVIKAGSTVIGPGSHLTRACDCRPLAAQGVGFPYIAKGGRLQAELIMSGTRSELTQVSPLHPMNRMAAAPT